jgi:flagellar biosynthesis/type III secretory pathway M-ring protein FliF/YscJ
MSTAINPETAALREEVEAQGIEIAEIRGNVQQLDKIVAATNRQSVWQLIALIVSLCVAIIAGLAYQTTMIEKRIEQIEKRAEQSEKNNAVRFEQIEKRIEQSEKNMTALLQQTEKNLSARFEDLKQEVRAQRK